MIVATCSAKHSPGATTTALALACAWQSGDAEREGPVLVVEVDPAGGDLAARLGTPADPGLATLAASARHDGVDVDVWRHSGPLPAGGAVVVGPTDPAQSESSIRTLGDRLVQTLRQARTDAVLDVGRWSPASISSSLIEAVDCVLLVAAPDLAGLEHARRAVVDLRRLSVPLIAVVTVGDRPYDPEDVRVATGIEHAFSLPIDRRGIAALLSGPPGRARRAPLVRGARSIVDDLLCTVGASL